MINKPYKLNGREVTYGSFEELQEVCNTVRKKMFEYITGKINEKQFFSIYCEFECSLLEHSYTSEEFEYDLPDYEPFINRGKKELEQTNLIIEMKEAIEWYMDNTTVMNDSRSYHETFHDLGMNLRMRAEDTLHTNLSK